MQDQSPFARAVYLQKYSMDGREEWPDTAMRVAENVMAAVGEGPKSDATHAVFRAIRDRKFIPGGRYLYASGRPLHQVQNCLLLRAEDTREGWGDIWYKAGMSLMTGAGIGIDYSRLREEDAPISRTGGKASGPVSLMHSVNEIGRQVMQGGARRSAIWAGLRWDHPDVLKFVRLKDWSPEMRALKAEDPSFPLPMEYTNISVQLDDDFFDAFDDPYHPLHGHAQHVYWKTVEKMTVTGEPGFSVDANGLRDESLRNACTEVTSADDSDICNLGSVNLARIETVEELREVTEVATMLLLAGTVYSDVPYPRVAEVRERNRRLGLGFMGLHEWLLVRGKPYGPDEELDSWLAAWADTTENTARREAARLGLSTPVKTRAIAPTGTIGIIAETTTGIEPIFCKAFKRRYLGPDQRWLHQFVVDPTAKRLVGQGVDPDDIEDAYVLSFQLGRRLDMQAFVQRHVDHGISSTINLPRPLEPGHEQREFGEMLYDRLPRLRGVTCYPDGARGGQPLEAVGYDYALRQEGVVFESDEAACVGGLCGV